MRVSEQLEIVSKIARELQSRYTYIQIDVFLRAFGIVPPGNHGNFGSKWTYSEAALTGVSKELIVKIANELEIASPSGTIYSTPPANWSGVSDLKLFISHISAEKMKATRLKDCLAPFGISGFVAHEDIFPTLEWQTEIEKALNTMDAFVAIHTPKFSESIWTQQEIGVAVGRGVKIISLKMGEDPTGFISKQQALPQRGRKAEEIARELHQLLANDPRTKDKLATRSFDSGLLDDVPF